MIARRRFIGARLPVAGGGLVALVFAVLWLPAAVAQETPIRAGPEAATDAFADWLDALLHWTIRGIEIAGIAVVVFGAVAATGLYLVRTARDGPTEGAYHAFRSSLGRAILLGLEFLVAADIIATVAIDPTIESVAVLAGLVLVRTFLSFALEVEIDGKWPWRKGAG